MFVKEMLNDNPRANAAIVNEAWRAAGMSGSISAGLVNRGCAVGDGFYPRTRAKSRDFSGFS
jgi:hypothetical protein